MSGRDRLIHRPAVVRLLHYLMIRCEVEQNEYPPAWHGMSAHDLMSQRTITWVVPLNIVAALLGYAWHQLRYGITRWLWNAREYVQKKKFKREWGRLITVGDVNPRILGAEHCTVYVECGCNEIHRHLFYMVGEDLALPSHCRRCVRPREEHRAEAPA